MRLGIDPKVDYAFKKLFGSEENKPLLIGFLKAVLREDIVEVEILNPFSDKDSMVEKLAILDIKARLGDGRLINIEMQMVVSAIYPNRALYYWAKTYHQQLGEGENYDQLHPTISIHILNAIAFPQLAGYHSKYRLLEIDHPGVVFSKHLEIHVIELPKFRASVEELTNSLERWCFFLRHGEDLEPRSLPSPLKQAEIEKAIEVLEIMNHNDRERLFYEGRQRAWRDAETLKQESNRAKELGLQEGKQIGIQEGIQEGKQIGIQEGKQIGIQEGKQIGIQEGRQEGEQIGLRTGILESIEMVLELKFGSESLAIMESFRSIEELAELRRIQHLLRVTGTLQEFRDRLATGSKPGVSS